MRTQLLQCDGLGCDLVQQLRQGEPESSGAIENYEIRLGAAVIGSRDLCDRCATSLNNAIVALLPEKKTGLIYFNKPDGEP